MLQHTKGNRPQAARELTMAEEDLFETGLFCNQEPEVLQKPVWWVLSFHFGFRARGESRRLKLGDIGKPNGDPRHGDGQHQRAFNPSVQATHNERCPVKLFKSFASHRPYVMKKPHSPFYLAIDHHHKPGCQVWSSIGKKRDWEVSCEGCQSR